MRRGTGLVATALGAFLIVSALLTRYYVAEQVIRFPLNEYRVATLLARNVSYFNSAELQELSGATLTDTSTTEGDVASGSASTAVWNNFSYIYDQTNNLPVSSSLQRLAFGRRSAELVNCCGANISGRKAHVAGLGYVWPFGAQQTSYQIFDTTLMKRHSIAYAGTATVDGLATYKYVETVTPAQIGTQELPGSLVGILDQATVKLAEYYTGTSTDYVDPITGAPVSVTFSRHLYLTDSSGKQVLNLMHATFVTTPASVAAAVQTARSDDARISVVRVLLPATLGLAGIILLLIGVLMARTRPESDYQGAASAGRSGGAPDYQGGGGFPGGQVPV